MSASHPSDAGERTPDATIADRWAELLRLTRGVDRDTRSEILGTVHVIRAAEFQKGRAMQQEADLAESALADTCNQLGEALEKITFRDERIAILERRCRELYDAHAARSPAPSDAIQETVRPDDQQNVGVDELPACQTSFRVADQQRVGSIAKTDNGRGVTSAGGESGLPHHNPDLWSRVCQSIDHSRVVAMAHTMDDFIGEIQKSEFSAKDVAAARRFLARVEECCDEIPAAPSEGARDAEPRELLCMVCDRDYPTWFAPNDLWNRVMRREDGWDRYAFICPSCFGMEARAAGIDGVFKFSVEERDVEVGPPFTDDEATRLRAWAADMDLRRAREMVAEAAPRSETASCKHGCVQPCSVCATEKTYQLVATLDVQPGSTGATSVPASMVVNNTSNRVEFRSPADPSRDADWLARLQNADVGSGEFAKLLLVPDWPHRIHALLTKVTFDERQKA